MIELLREKYSWKYGLADLTKSGEAGYEIGGGGSGGSSEIMCEEFFYQIGQNWFSTHRGFQIYPCLAGHKNFWLRKWPSKLKSHFFSGSFSRLTFKSGGDPV